MVDGLCILAAPSFRGEASLCVCLCERVSLCPVRHSPHVRLRRMPLGRRMSSRSFGLKTRQCVSGYCVERTDLRGVAYLSVCAPAPVALRLVPSIPYGTSFWPSYLMGRTPGGGSLPARRGTGLDSSCRSLTSRRQVHTGPRTSVEVMPR